MKRRLSIKTTVYPDGYDKSQINSWYEYIAKTVLKLTGKTTQAK